MVRPTCVLNNSATADDDDGILSARLRLCHLTSFHRDAVPRVCPFCEISFVLILCIIEVKYFATDVCRIKTTNTSVSLENSCLSVLQLAVETGVMLFAVC